MDTVNKCLLDSCTEAVAHSRTLLGTVATAITGVGISTVFGWLERGVGFVAALAGLLVTIALWRKIRAERRETELRIRVLEQQLSGNKQSGKE